MKTPNWKPIELNNQCGICTHYIPKLKENVRTARGNCQLTGKYKQRTESCKKFKLER